MVEEEMLAEIRPFRRRRLAPDQGRDAALRALATPLAERAKDPGAYLLDDPETLLPLLEALRQRWETDPQSVLAESTFLYEFLEQHDAKYPLGAFLLDEREYFLGETSRIAGNVCRALSKRAEAYRWLDLAEGWFRLTENAAGNLSKVAYHRLALRLEERDFAAVAELLPQLIASFEKLGMTEDALKTKFLHAGVLKETDRLSEAAEVFSDIAKKAEESKIEPLLAHAYVNLSQIHSFRGQTDQALYMTQLATPLLRKLGYRMALAKLQWAIGYLLRANGRADQAIDAYREAQTEFGEIGMRADVAAVHLVVADLLLDNGQDKQAEWEIRQALPIIDEYKLVPEGFAALSLLRESVRRQKIDRTALRNLHGYFEELSS
jgi:tetratricopeptide (TPR) repeat protein